ncbi:MAG TPA: hypothetical protein VHA37_01760 [Candidatus Saccharimonadales bacterium]|nr:hypothetical protein [Candidatus Saccharimonadales bacterium]
MSASKTKIETGTEQHAVPSRTVHAEIHELLQLAFDNKRTVKAIEVTRRVGYKEVTTRVELDNEVER